MLSSYCFKKVMKDIKDMTLEDQGQTAYMDIKREITLYT